MQTFSLAKFARLRQALKQDDLHGATHLLGGPCTVPHAILESRVPGGYTALLVAAAARNQAGILTAILKHYQAISNDSRQAWMNKALQDAASYGRVQNIELLLESGAARLSRDIDGRTALDYAAMAGRIGAIDALMSNMEMEIFSQNIYSPLTFALRFGRREAADHLVRSGMPIDMFSALFLHRKEILTQYFMHSPQSFHAPLPGARWGMVVGPCLIHVAVLTEDIEMVDYLLAQNAGGDALTENGYSGICLAALEARRAGELGRLDLVDVGTGQDRKTILSRFLARENALDLPSTVALDDKPAFDHMLPNAPFQQRAVALIVAMCFDARYYVQKILHTKQKQDRAFPSMALAMSLRHKDDNLTQMLLNHGLDPRDANPLVGIFAYDDSRRLRMFLEAGLDPDYSFHAPAGMFHLIHECCDSGAINCLAVLLEKKADVTAKEKSPYGFTPMHIAALSDHANTPVILEMLHAAGATANERDDLFAETPAAWLEYVRQS